MKEDNCSAQILLEQEVRELTLALRSDPLWADLREVLANQGYRAADVMLAGFVENEEDAEWGAIVTMSGEVYAYERSTKQSAPATFTRFERVEDVDRLIEEMFPAVDAA